MHPVFEIYVSSVVQYYRKPKYHLLRDLNLSKFLIKFSLTILFSRENYVPYYLSSKTYMNISKKCCIFDVKFTQITFRNFYEPIAAISIRIYKQICRKSSNIHSKNVIFTWKYVHRQILHVQYKLRDSQQYVKLW